MDREFIFAFLLNIISTCAFSDEWNHAPVKWAHGYKTPYVIATRYSNPIVGFNIGFDFPKNGYDSDRVDMIEWLNKNGVHSYQSGGAPFATIYAKIDGVTDIESANIFLMKFLPKFDAWVRKNLRKD